VLAAVAARGFRCPRGREGGAGWGEAVSAAGPSAAAGPPSRLFTFCLKGDLLRHRASHGSESGHCCPLCGDSFRHKRELQAHLKEHAAGSACHKCPDCKERFEDEASLSRHRAAHGEERPFRCGRCGRSFSWQESLLIHQRSHAQERSHKCPVCGRCFSRRGNLLAHQRVHTGERPFLMSRALHFSSWSPPWGVAGNLEGPIAPDPVLEPAMVPRLSGRGYHLCSQGGHATAHDPSAGITCWAGR
uniref:C2H2-type domain-containing protein n=1 Tax=Amazona collaria TaxID=241587 RepID=A0A8B9EY55_9PSIT